MSVDSPECEIHKESGEHEADVTLAEEEQGHYSGTHTFAPAGVYEVHFNFIHEGEPEERHFDITVQSQ